MVQLKPKDRADLKRLLRALPGFAHADGRAEVLLDAGLDQFVYQIDLTGAADLAAGRMITNLSNFGRLTWDHEALGLLLNSVKESVGFDQAKLLDRLLTEYDMMTPIARSPDMDEWHGTETNESVLEKIVGENTLRRIAFLEEGLRISRSVAYVGIGTSSGTGFMITPHLFITNQHVIEEEPLLARAIFRFNYQENFMGEAQNVVEFRAKVGGKFRTNAALDYTIVELDGKPGEEWKWLPLRARDIKRDDRTNIIQHPGGRSKHISFQNNFVEYVGEDIVQYVTSTQRGSSGSPVLNDEWEVVALHHSGGDIREPATGRRYFRNEGILISSILDDLPPEFKDPIEEAATP